MENVSDREPTPQFKGVWIPKSIWNAADLTWMEKCLLAEINSLEDDKVGGCFASNAYLAKRFHTSPSYIAKTLCMMTAHGYLKKVAFDGRVRVMKSLYPNAEGLPLGKGGDYPEVIENPKIGDIGVTLKLPVEVRTVCKEKKEKPDWVEKIYESYPRKINRKKAIEAIRKAVKKHGTDTVLAGTLNHASAFQREIQSGRQRYVPHPATFFNAERYLEEPEMLHEPLAPINRQQLQEQLKELRWDRTALHDQGKPEDPELNKRIAEIAKLLNSNP